MTEDSSVNVDSTYMKVVRYCTRLPTKFTAKTDWELWLMRFDAYADKAKIGKGDQGKELLSLLDDEPFRHHELENSEVKGSLFQLTSFYSDDLDAEIFDEWLQWTEFEKALYPKAASRRQAHEMLSTLKEHRSESAFPNIFIALRINLTLPVSGERSFSHLKRIKNALRSTMVQDQCSGNYRHYSIHLMFGREPRLPEDIMFGIPAEEYTSPEQYSHILVERVKRGYQLVRDHAEKKQKHQKDMFDRKLFLKGTQGNSADHGWGLLRAVCECLTLKYGKTGMGLEWQMKLQRRVQRRESLLDFAGELRMIASKVFLDWSNGNWFVINLVSPIVQMQLMKDMPRSINDAVELARKLETAEQAQRRLCQERRDQIPASALMPVGKGALEDKLDRLTADLQKLTERMAGLSSDSLSTDKLEPRRRTPL
ncbi:hypothetical protein EMCRGX_G017617 [Ephydatia muelleri]